MARQHWWQDRPAWFDALHASEPGLGWIEDEAEARQIVARIAEPYLEGGGPSGYFLADAHVADVRARWMEGDAIVPLAQLAERTDRRGLIAWRPTLFADRTRPESLHWALDERMPPIFWVDAGTDAASVRAAFAPYAPGRLPWRPAMYRSTRFFVGAEAALDIGIEGLVGWLAQKPLVDGLEWGSAHIDDPWADRVEAGALVIARAAADHSLQAPGALPSTSVRTALGGSHLTVASFEGFLTVEARYAPAPHGSTLAFLHAMYGVPNVPELPIDVAVALFGMRLSNADALFAQLRSPDARPARGAYAMALTALLHDDARRLGALLDELAADPETRAAAIELSVRLDLSSRLYAMLATETDPDLRARLLEATSLGGAP